MRRAIRFTSFHAIRPAAFAGAVVLLTLAPLAARAQSAPDDLGRVEVRGQQPPMPLRTDVRRSCPQVDAQLQDALALPIYLQGVGGLVRAEFVLEKGRVHAVSATGGPRVYHPEIRQALRRLVCVNEDMGGQRFQVLLSFRPADEAERSGEPPVALLQLP